MEVKGMAKEITEGITADPKIMAGKPVIKGTRMPVELVLAKLAVDPNLEEFFLDYPEITIDQVKACIHYAAKLVQNKKLSGLGTGMPESVSAPL